MMHRLFCAFVMVLITAVSAVGQERPRVVVVNQALQSFAQQLLGESADVVFPVPEGVDPSFWRPTIADISMVQSADLIILNGAGFATWVDRVSLPRSRLVNTTAAIKDQFIVTESITHSHGDGGEHSHEGLASYTWLDPVLAAAQADAVAAAIISRNLAEEADVTARLAALRSELETLDAEAKSLLGTFGDVSIIATHPRYQYLARRYGLSIASLEWEAGTAPSSEELVQLESMISETGARVLLWEAAPPDGAIATTDALGITSVVFPPLSRHDPAQTYLPSLTSSITALAAALAE